MFKLTINNSVVGFIGDPHLGKKFSNVQLHRVGEREAHQLLTFRQQLNDKECDIIVMVGDLFDTYNVSNSVLLSAYNEIKFALEQNPNTQYVFLYGNHDISRNDEVIPSIEVLRNLLAEEKNLFVVRDTARMLHLKGITILGCPYSYHLSAHDSVLPFAEQGIKVDLAVGHWDTVVMSGEHNLIPLHLLKNMTKLVVTGHEHGTGTNKHEDVYVYKTGSMLPYSHGEDEEGLFYVTRTLEQLREELEVNPRAYYYKHVRVILFEGEELPSDIDCLAITSKKANEEEIEDDGRVEAQFGEFSFKEIFFSTMEENAVSEDTAKEYWDKYTQEARHD